MQHYPSGICCTWNLSAAYSSASDVGKNVYFLEQDPSVRLVGAPIRNTPPFLVPSGEYLAWAFPASGSASGYASATSTSGSFYGAGSVIWSGFQMPQLPTCSNTNNVNEAVVKDVYAVASYTATSLNNLSANLSAGGASLSPAPSNGIGVSQSSSLGTSLPGSITAKVTGTGEGSLDITSVAAAVTYKLKDDCPSSGGSGGSGGIGSGGDGTTPPESSTPTYNLTLVDPYLLVSGNAPLISPDAAIAAGNTASGIIADGTSTAIAVVGINPNGGSAPTSDVTFSVSNGATLAPFDPSFLNTAPSSWSTSDSSQTTLVVPAANLVQSGGSYYALALVTASSPANTDFYQTIVVHAPTGDGYNQNEATQTMTTYPVPTVFIHGLWSDQDALKYTKKFMQGSYPFNNDPDYFLTAICYSKYLAFDADSDPMPNAGAGCEQTSTQALDGYLVNLYGSLEKNGIVGGRVDVVAHSMGGLVARNYASGASKSIPYNNTGSRGQGIFRDVVTLDTPETGSILAWYLDNVYAPMKEDPSQYPTYNPLCTMPGSIIPCIPHFPSLSSNIWALGCGFNPSTTFRECMASKFYNKPLAPQDADLSTGAVASLVPGNSHLTRTTLLDPAAIPNANWFAVAANYQAGGASKLSNLEISNDDFYAALYPVLSDSAVTASISSVTSMMTDFSNPNAPPVCADGTSQAGIFHPGDVIVPLCSQTYHAIPGQTYTLPGLVHAPMGNMFIKWLSSIAFNGFQATSVTQSDAVKKQVACWLGYRSCPSSLLTQDKEALDDLKPDTVKTAAQKVVEEQDIFHADERMTASIPDVQVKLAQPLQIPVSFIGGNPVSIFVEQRKGNDSLENEYAGVEVGSGEAKVTLDNGSSKIIEITPVQVGALDIVIHVVYDDGGITEKQYQINVVSSSDGVKKFSVNSGFSSVDIVLGDDDKYRQSWLSPEVYYDNLDYPVHLTDCTQIKFTVDQPEDGPVISLDSDGTVHGLRPGVATITADYEGIQDSVIVHVYAKEGAPTIYRRVQGQGTIAK